MDEINFINEDILIANCERVMIGFINSMLETKTIVSRFYKEIRNVIFAYANKHAPQLTDKMLFTFSYLNAYHICTQIRIKPDT